MRRVLVVNAGSSTLKLRVLEGDDAMEDDDAIVADEMLDPWDGAGGPVVDELFGAAADVDAVGHRVVHGGGAEAPAVIDDAEVDRIASLTVLAPLHQPRAIAAIEAARRRLPDVPHVACFDTAFHATLSPAARTFALPGVWRARWGLQRSGFHGLSHAWIARRAPAVAGLGDGAVPRIVSCHLGAGASACAIGEGRSVDTTMGFTPLDGLVMATRSGAVDPGILLWLLRTGGLDVETVADGLERHAGLAGLSGTDGDLRHVLLARTAGDSDAALAIDVYLHRLRAAIAALAAALGGVDVLAFTGGVGEHQPAIRSAAAAGLAFLGVALDEAANAGAAAGDADVSAASAPVRTVVIQAREDLEIARQTRAALSA